MALNKMQLKGALTRSALLGVVLVGVLAGAMVLARRGPAVLAKVTDTESQSQEISAPEVKRLMVAEPRATAARPSKAAAKPTAPKPTAPKPVVLLASAAKPVAESPAAAVAETLEVITITGCLQHDDGTFRLKDTAGSDAPKARSWKSGFLKKQAASVEIVDSANRLGLPMHVGQRVTVTGILLNKEMRARAVQRLGVCS